MLHALLHGKLDELTPEPQRLEDALTSTVFGTLVWLEQWDLLEQWLTDEGYRCLEGTHPAGTHEAWFWPRLANGVQPDVILRLGKTLVIVEAKYRADRHDRSVSQDDGEVLGDQLWQQSSCITTPPDKRIRYAEPIEAAIRECRFVHVFLVNARRRRAREQYRESAALLPSLRLANWQDLYRHLNVPRFARSTWVVDLRAYLQMTGLDPFEGIGGRISRPQATAGVLKWHAQRTAIGIRQAVHPVVGFTPLPAVWRMSRPLPLGVRSGVADARATRRVLKWRASRQAAPAFRQVTRDINALRPLASAWRVSGLTEQGRPRLRDLDARLVSNDQIATLLKWHLPDQPVRKRGGER